MKQTYLISGMTCEGCVASVTEKLSKVDGIKSVHVSLEKCEAEVDMLTQIPIMELKAALPNKYAIKTAVSELKNPILTKPVEVKSKLQQLKPLFLIFVYLFSAAIFLNYSDWSTQEAMLDFMGLFYIVFSFFKFLDLKGFSKSFQRYDPLTKVFSLYGWIYPFLELILGLLLLMRMQVQIALMATIIILGITTIGVMRTLLDKRAIRCACLGTALQLPMTEATFIENAIMLLMAFGMLIF